MRIMRRLVSVNYSRLALAGAVATGVYTLAMYVDIALTGNDADDVQLIEGIVRGERKHWPIVGWIGQLGNGYGLAGLYASVFDRLLPGPGWLRGLLFGEGFILAVWPLTPLLDRYHPLIRRGQLPRYCRLLPLVQNLVRHGLFGLALGLLYRDRRARSH